MNYDINKCPTDEQIVSYIDNKDDDILQHFNSCEICRKKLADYIKFNTFIEDTNTIKPEIELREKAIGLFKDKFLNQYKSKTVIRLIKEGFELVANTLSFASIKPLPAIRGEQNNNNMIKLDFSSNAYKIHGEMMQAEDNKMNLKMNIKEDSQYYSDTVSMKKNDVFYKSYETDKNGNIKFAYLPAGYYKIFIKDQEVFDFQLI